MKCCVSVSVLISGLIYNLTGAEACLLVIDIIAFEAETALERLHSETGSACLAHRDLKLAVDHHSVLVDISVPQFDLCENSLFVFDGWVVNERAAFGVWWKVSGSSELEAPVGKHVSEQVSKKEGSRNWTHSMIVVFPLPLCPTMT